MRRHLPVLMVAPQINGFNKAMNDRLAYDLNKALRL